MADLPSLLPSFHSLISLMEEHAPKRLTDAVAMAAVGLSDPFAIGMGIDFERLDDSGCVATLPDRWRNRDRDGRPHPSAITALAQLATRESWARHVDVRVVKMRLSRLELRCDGTVPAGDLRLSYVCEHDEREAALLRLRSTGRSRASCQTRLFDSAGRLVGEIDLDWELEGKPLLSRGQGSAHATKGL